MVITTNDFLVLFPEIENLYKQNVHFKMNAALKILKMYKEAYEINSYILNRIKILIPGLEKEGYVMSKDERTMYDAILLSPIEFDTYGLTEEDLTDACDVVIGLSSLEKILKIL